MSLFKEFRPALLFLSKFLGIYLLGNILYGVYVESYGEEPDSATNIVAQHTCASLNMFGVDAETTLNKDRPTVILFIPGNSGLNIYEGCNGLNVMIVFVAFIVAFGGPLKSMLWFIPAGIVTIHLFNLGRLSLLFYVAEHFKESFYFFHKYFFTAIIYIAVFLLWVVWVIRFNGKKKSRMEGAGNG